MYINPRVFRVLTLISVLICSFPSLIQSANILLLEGVPSPSHHLWMRVLSTELVRQGHNVTSLSCDVETTTPKNLTYLHLDQVYATLFADYSANGPVDVFEYASIGSWTKLLISRFWAMNKFRGTLKSQGFQRLLDYPDDFPFELIIFDTIASPAMMVFIDKFANVPVISVTPFPLIYPKNHISGAPYSPSFIPNQNLDKFENTFMGRLNNFLLTWTEHYYTQVYLGNLMKSELAERVTMKRTVDELYRKTKLVMPNYHPAVNLVQPTMPMVVPVGGLQIQEPKALPIDLEELFSSAPLGVVYFSLGTNIQSEQLGHHRLTELIEAFRALPEYTILWKIKLTGLDLQLPRNVHVRDWLPQNDILAHKKTLLFISHGGGLSTQESTWYGVPMLGVPVFLDQHPNVNLAVAAGTAISVDLKEINRVKFRGAILEMITNPKYRTNAQLRSKNFRDQKEHPLQRAIWWIDFVLRNPDISFLKHPSLDQMNIFLSNSIDIIAFLVILTLVLLYLFYRVVLRMLFFFCRRSHISRRKKIE